MVRVVGSAVLVVAALAIWLGMAPEPVMQSAAGEIAAAQALADLNEESAEGAPQQAVVNGWHTVDLLEIIATDSMTPEPVDHRTEALLLLGVIGLAFGIATSPRGGSAPRPSSSQPVGPILVPPRPEAPQNSVAATSVQQTSPALNITPGL